MEDVNQKQIYEQMLVHYEGMAEYFVELEQTDFILRYPQQYKYGLDMLAQIEERLYFLKWSFQQKHNLIIKN